MIVLFTLAAMQLVVQAPPPEGSRRTVEFGGPVQSRFSIDGPQSIWGDLIPYEACLGNSLMRRGLRFETMAKKPTDAEVATAVARCAGHRQASRINAEATLAEKGFDAAEQGKLVERALNSMELTLADKTAERNAQIYEQFRQIGKAK